MTVTKLFTRCVFWASVLILNELLRLSPLRAGDELPRVFLLRTSDLMEARKRAQSNDASLLPVLNRLKHDADNALNAGPFSVINKPLLPPNGDKHDYRSTAPYWWPNPNSANGLPYVRRDGEMNPERDKTSDRSALDAMIQNVKTLGLAYFFTGRESYATQAAKLLRVWFLDEATKMNPNLKYAQAIPGRNQGRSVGIIETHNLPELIDAVGLLHSSPAWRPNDGSTLQKWFDAYLTWLLESPEGRAESKARNNHGSWYDVQTASFALFVDKKDLARKILGEFGTKRIAQQIEPDGRQPHELERTQSWNYSLFNLKALFAAASLGDNMELDLWNFETPDKRSIRKALDWLLPFAIGAKKWSYEQISSWQPEKLAPFLRRAAVRYHELSYEKAISKLSGGTGDERMQLLYPR